MLNPNPWFASYRTDSGDVVLGYCRDSSEKKAVSRLDEAMKELSVDLTHAELYVGEVENLSMAAMNQMWLESRMTGGV